MFTNKETQQVPNTTFPIITSEGWASRNSDEIFANKTVVVFSLPGAFTPTCSSSHLPRYNELAAKFSTNGVDEIICISVNDTFVPRDGKRNEVQQNLTQMWKDSSSSSESESDYCELAEMQCHVDRWIKYEEVLYDQIRALQQQRHRAQGYGYSC